jgi:hypothetical protein
MFMQEPVSSYRSIGDRARGFIVGVWIFVAKEFAATKQWASKSDVTAREDGFL